MPVRRVWLLGPLTVALLAVAQPAHDPPRPSPPASRAAFVDLYDRHPSRSALVPLPAPIVRPLPSEPNRTITPRAAPAPSVPSSDAWACILRHESGGNYRDNTGNGYYGAYQFSLSTWRSMGTGYSRADLAPPAVQDDAARRLQARSGWNQWPLSSRLCHLR